MLDFQAQLATKLLGSVSPKISDTPGNAALSAVVIDKISKCVTNHYRLQAFLATVQVEAELAHRRVSGSSSEHGEMRLRSALTTLNAIAQKVRVHPNDKESARLNRAVGLVKELLEDKSASDHFGLACQQSPDDPMVAISYAETRFAVGGDKGLNEAIGVLARIQKKHPSSIPVR